MLIPFLYIHLIKFNIISLFKKRELHFFWTEGGHTITSCHGESPNIKSNIQSIPESPCND